jgi:hypothetical protein
MKKLVVIGVILIAIFIFVLNATMIANQAEKWVKENPKDPDAPKVLFYAARYCDILGDNAKAQSVYWEIYQLYPEKSTLCAEALYYEAENKVETAAATRSYAIPILDIILNQYPSEEEWAQKAKTLKDEVTYVR